jgi:hypothetical protein
MSNVNKNMSVRATKEKENAHTQKRAKTFIPGLDLFFFLLLF